MQFTMKTQEAFMLHHGPPQLSCMFSGLTDLKGMCRNDVAMSWWAWSHIIVIGVRKTKPPVPIIGCCSSYFNKRAKGRTSLFLLKRRPSGLEKCFETVKHIMPSSCGMLRTTAPEWPDKSRSGRLALPLKM